MIEMRRFVQFFYRVENFSKTFFYNIDAFSSVFDVTFSIALGKILIGINLQESSKVYFFRPDRWQFANGTVGVFGWLERYEDARKRTLS